ncbi:MAG: 50S ribosomal protein L19e [Promethearchaeota archaeon]
MNTSAQRRIAAEILKCGKNRVYMDPEFLDEIEMAITRDDISNLIRQGIIRKRQIIGVSRSKANLRHDRKIRGRARGLGKRKGKRTARMPRKRAWINQIRPQRRKLKELRDEGKIERSTYRKLYLQAKGGAFKSTNFMLRYMEENKLIRKK